MSPHPPSVRRRIPWGYLVYTLPLAYVFWAPYEHGAGALEWIVTALTFAAVLALFLAGLTYGGHRRLAAALCVSLLLIAIGALAYRPGGGLYFPVAATFVPVAAAGSMPLLMTLLSAIAVLFGLEWRALYLTHGVFLPLFVAAEIYISGIGACLAIRHTQAARRDDQARERERIAQDLHDVLGSTLSSLALKAELARRVFHTDPARALRETGEVERMARQGLEDMRAAVQGYCAGDIQAELDRVVALLTAAGIRVERRQEPVEMPPASERVLALILREAVTNILRHSQARACRIALYRAASACRLEIADNGRGGEHEEGVGMRSICARAEALGGTAVWASGVGTQLCVSLPLACRSPEHRCSEEDA